MENPDTVIAAFDDHNAAENAMIAHDHLAPGMHVMTKPFSIDLLTRRVSALIEAE